jgi:non-ribosomal peptide synthetase component F
MADHFRIFLNDIVSNPEKKISELRLLSIEEEDKILYKWNDTEHTFEDFICLHKLIEEQVNKTPDNIAVVFEDKHLTYKELNKRSNKLAHLLIRRGAGPHTLTGICAERSLEMVIAILGVLKAGGAYIPIDPEYPRDRVDFMISDSKAKIIITQKNIAEKLPEDLAEVFLLDDDKNEISKQDDTDIENNTALENPAYVIYTSGSTGMPKGVMISHASIVNHMLWMKEEFGFAQ